MRLLLSVLLIISVSSCSINSTYNNRESDKKDAEEITKELYRCLSENELQKAISLFSPKFFSVTDTSKLYELINMAKEDSGSIESYLLANWQTCVIKGTDARSDYVLMYIVRRQKKDTQETITLQKENGKIKIIGYNVNYKP